MAGDVFRINPRTIPFRPFVAVAAADLGLSPQIERQIEHAIFEVFDPRQVGETTPVMDGNSDGQSLLVGAFAECDVEILLQWPGT